ncbi:MAG: cytochrome P450 [Gammaproteobacteria bacterium]
MSDHSFQDHLESFDLRALPDAFYDDPYPFYRALRERCPVYRCPDGSYFVTRYADVLGVYRDHARLSSDKRVEFAPKFGDGLLYEHHTTSLVFRDPPRHTVVRKLIHGFFTPRALAAIEPRITALVDGMLDEFEQTRQMNLIEHYAFSLPAEVVCDLLGIPPGDRSELRTWARAILGALEPAPAPESIAAGNAAVTCFCAYLRELAELKRRTGSNTELDVLSTLVEAVDRASAREDDQRIGEAELLHNCIFMLNAGHETTTNLIGNGVNALLERPHALARLRANPELLTTAVDELLRFESSNQLGNRRALCDLCIGGKALPAGALITLCIGAANRDPAQFPDADELVLARQPNRHLAFAAGIHTCAGVALARMEARIAIGRLIQRFPTLHKCGPIERDRRARFRVVARLPVAA